MFVVSTKVGCVGFFYFVANDDTLPTFFLQPNGEFVAYDYCILLHECAKKMLQENLPTHIENIAIGDFQF